VPLSGRTGAASGTALLARAVATTAAEQTAEQTA
jgi:hypothetical protein